MGNSSSVEVEDDRELEVPVLFSEGLMSELTGEPQKQTEEEVSHVKEQPETQASGEFDFSFEDEAVTEFVFFFFFFFRLSQSSDSFSGIWGCFEGF